MDLAQLARRQHGVVSRAQALERVTPSVVRWQLASGRWRRIHAGVMALHTGELTWWGRASAAVLHAGPGAALAFLSAAYAVGLTDAPPAVLSVAIPAARQVQRVPGVRIARRRRLVIVERRGLSVLAPAVTVIDLGATPGTTATQATAWAAQSVAKRLVTATDLSAELRRRRVHPHRRALALAFGDIDGGAQSALELSFVRRVLRAHSLPPMRQQVVDDQDGVSIRRDFEHEETGTIIEVDGRIGHEGSGVARDRRRDRFAATRGKITVRLGWWDVEREPCVVAADLLGILRTRGYRGPATRCGVDCPVGALP